MKTERQGVRQREDRKTGSQATWRQIDRESGNVKADRQGVRQREDR